MTLADVAFVVIVLSLAVIVCALAVVVGPELIRRWQWWLIKREAVRRRRVLDRAFDREVRGMEQQLNAHVRTRDRELATWRKGW